MCAGLVSGLGVMQARVAHAETPTAAEFFDAGLRDADAGNFQDAQRALLAAYALSPHPDVLYNLVLVSLKLGDTATVLRLLQSAETSRDEAASSPTFKASASPPTNVAPLPPPVEPHAPRSNSIGEPSPAVLPQRLSRSNLVGQAVAENDLLERRWELPALALTTGLAFVGGGISLYVWNDHQYRTAKRELESLSSDPPKYVSSRTEASAISTNAERVGRAESRLATASAFDVVSLALAGTGAILTGLGTYWALSVKPSATLTSSSVALTVQGAW